MQAWTEFGRYAGNKMAIIVCTVYGLKSTGAPFRNHLADCMQHSGWSSCMTADADVLMKPEILGEDGYMVYVFCLLCALC